MTPLKHSGDRRLSEVSRHLVMPDGIETTAWPLVSRQLQKMDTPLDTWQQGLMTAILAKRADGMYACGIGGAVLSIARQSGKTYTIGSLIFAICSANPNTLVLWSAHRVKTHNETFRTMDSMAQKPGVKPFVRRVLTGANSEAIEFANGSRILFGARADGFGRGFAKVDIVVLDEAQILTEKAMEDMVPATNAAPNGLVIMMGTPPRPGDPGEVFTNRRKAALSGDDKNILYVEMSADKNANPDDREQWAKANPSFPGRTTETAILRMRSLLGSADSFRREGMGIWDEAALAKRAIDADVWDLRRIEPAAVPSAGRKVFGVRFTVDGSMVALAAAMRPDDDGPVHVEAIKQATMGEGTQWLVDFLVDRREEMAQVVVDGKSGVGYLVNALRAEKVPAKAILTPSTDDAVAAHSMTEAAITQGGLTHRGQPALDDQVKAARRRKIGTAGGFGWEASEGESVAMFEAATLALWGAKTTKRKPGRKAVPL